MKKQRVHAVKQDFQLGRLRKKQGSYLYLHRNSSAQSLSKSTHKHLDLSSGLSGDGFGYTDAYMCSQLKKNLRRKDQAPPQGDASATSSSHSFERLTKTVKHQLRFLFHRFPLLDQYYHPLLIHSEHWYKLLNKLTHELTKNHSPSARHPYAVSSQLTALEASSFEASFCTQTKPPPSTDKTTSHHHALHFISDLLLEFPNKLDHGFINATKKGDQSIVLLSTSFPYFSFLSHELLPAAMITHPNAPFGMNLYRLLFLKKTTRPQKGDDFSLPRTLQNILEKQIPSNATIPSTNDHASWTPLLHPHWSALSLSLYRQGLSHLATKETKSARILMITKAIEKTLTPLKKVTGISIQKDAHSQLLVRIFLTQEKWHHYLVAIEKRGWIALKLHPGLFRIFSPLASWLCIMHTQYTPPAPLKEPLEALAFQNNLEETSPFTVVILLRIAIGTELSHLRKPLHDLQESLLYNSSS